VAPDKNRVVHGERRWPMAVATLVAAGMHVLLPPGFSLLPDWAYLSVVLVMLGLLIAGDPGVLDRERPWLRVVTGLLIAFMAVGNLVAAVRLSIEIIQGSSLVSDPYVLLGVGAAIWATNVITFALWFWDVDGGGSVARSRNGAWHDPAFVFPEMHLPELKGTDWYARFVDYLALSFNTATAFSPTDVSAIKGWAKLLMLVESSISLVLATLVVATAINGLGS
jgi:hypothetical protein